ncbi:hypothetical protein [Streptomyces sp. NPDC000405]|uniref:hypothetical protein n=1 Tax=Streptomyces sp. NPDC000405 TaxID=3161033 RepID=UPI00398D68C1
MVTPQFVDELIGGHHPTQPDQKQSQNGPVPWRAEAHLLGPAPSRHHSEGLERQI